LRKSARDGEKERKDRRRIKRRLGNSDKRRDGYSQKLWQVQQQQQRQEQQQRRQHQRWIS
jgi:hypothetical protein